MAELDIDPFLQFTRQTATYRDVAGAVGLASDEDKGTWLTSGGERVAAIVPVDIAVVYEQLTGLPIDELPPGVAGPYRQP